MNDRAHLRQLTAAIRLARWLSPKGTGRGAISETLAGAKVLSRALPRDPKWARFAAPWLKPGWLRSVLTVYGRPREFALTAAMVGGVTVLDALHRRRTVAR